MRKTRFLSGATVIALASGLIPIVNASTAYADEADSTTLGNSAQLSNGSIIQRWTVSGLGPSTDVIPYPVAGTLWEATATDQAITGSATPIVSNFNARTPDGHDYRVLFGVATPQGVNPATLAQGQTTAGKIYFDVTGAAPDSVVFNAAGLDLAVWRPAPPPPAASPGTRPAPTAAGSQNPPTAGSTPAPTAPAAAGVAAPQPAPAAGSVGTPVPLGSTGTPVAPTPAASATAPEPAAVGSAGTPLPASSAGTPVVVPGAPPATSTVPATTAAPNPAAAESAGAPLTPTTVPAPVTTITAAPTAP